MTCIPGTKWLRVLALAAPMLLAACGGGEEAKGTTPLQSTGTTDTRRTALAASAAETEVGSPFTILSLNKISEARIARTIYEYKFTVTLRNDGRNRGGMRLSAVSNTAATAIVSGSTNFASAAAGATVTSTNQITVRHDRSVPFDPAQIAWMDVSPASVGRVIDGYLRGAIVYWDCNGNKNLDASEVSVLSGAGGTYKIDAPPSDRCELFAVVPAGAIDEDSPALPVAKTYQLAAAPARTDLITPYTTLVYGAVSTNQSSTVAVADEELRKLLGFDCGTLITDYKAASAPLTTACKNILTFFAKQVTSTLQSLPGSASYDDALALAKSNLQLAVATSPGYLQTVALGFDPFVYQVNSFTNYLSLRNTLPAPNDANRVFPAILSGSRVVDEELKAIALQLNAVNRGTAYGYLNLESLSDTDLSALMKRLVRVVESDPLVANAELIKRARASRAKMLKNTLDTYDSGVEAETKLYTLFTNEPAATVKFISEVSVASLTAAVDVIDVSASVARSSTRKTLSLPFNAPRKTILAAVERIRQRLDLLESGSELGVAVVLWLDFADHYTDSPTQSQAEELAKKRFDALMATSDALTALGKTVGDNKSYEAFLSTFSSATHAVLDRNERVKAFVDVAEGIRDIVTAAFGSVPVVHEIVSGLDIILQVLKGYIAGQDLVDAAAAHQEQAVQLLTKDFQASVNAAFRDYYIQYIQAYASAFKIVDTAQESSVRSLIANRQADLNVEVLVSFAQQPIESLPLYVGDRLCSFKSADASARSATYSCLPSDSSTSLRFAVGQLNSIVPGTPVWLDVALPAGVAVSNDSPSIVDRVVVWIQDAYGVVSDVFWQLTNVVADAADRILVGFSEPRGDNTVRPFETVLGRLKEGVWTISAWLNNAYTQVGGQPVVQTITVSRGTVQVGAVSPLLATVSEAVTFTVTGVDMPDGLAFILPGCEGIAEVASDAPSTQRKFTCSFPALTVPSVKSGSISTSSHPLLGTLLLPFEVTVVAAATPATELFDTFEGTAVHSNKWNIDGWPGTGATYCGSLCTSVGTVDVNGGLAQFGASGRISTKGKVVFSGDGKIVIEGRMAGPGAMRDTSLMLIDTVSKEQIEVGDTNYAGWGFYVFGIGSYNLVEPGVADPTANVTALGGSAPDFMEYRVTLEGKSILIERGPTLANITQSARRTLGRSIVGRTFYLSLGVSWAYYPGTIDWIRVTASPAAPATASKLQDTGVLGCTDYAFSPFSLNHSVGLDCTLSADAQGDPIPARQDAAIGRDALAAKGQLAKVGAGPGGFDFTKLDANGAMLPASASEWACVRDNHTQLVWENKTNDGGLRDYRHRYTWYSSDSSSNGGYAGSPGAGTCGGTLGTSCNTQAYVEAMNLARLCGSDKWRLPKLEELRSIVNFGRVSPSLDTDWFSNLAFVPGVPGNSAVGFWSSNLYSAGPFEAVMGMEFSYGLLMTPNKASALAMRAVAPSN